MAANQPPWPREWLMTDERMGDRLWVAIAALPAGSGVLFRHYAAPGREAVAVRVAEICRERKLLLDVAADVALAAKLGAQLVHNPNSDPGNLPFSRSAHSRDEATSACRSGASLIFLSPLFPTRSHPGAVPLSREIAREIVAACPMPVIALGGMDRRRFEEIGDDGFYGWAGIDAWLGAGPSRE